jgi:hypothetical protein
VEQLFISSNCVHSLRGIEFFKCLRVLSVSYNNISRISELKLLATIPLETLNMEGNPITKLPYYQHRVVALIPTLRLFDGRPVNEGLRSRAASTIAFDDQRLTELCVNELRLSTLRQLVEEEDRRDAQWLSDVQHVLGPMTLDMSQSEIDESFDKMREVALDLREKQRGSQKWANIYDTIESIQRRALDDLSTKIQPRIQSIRSPAISRLVTPSPVRTLSRQRTESPAHSRVSDVHIINPHTSEGDTLFPSDRLLDLQRKRKLHRIIQSWRTLSREPTHVGHLGRIIAANLAKVQMMRLFHCWKSRFLARQRGCTNGRDGLLEQAKRSVARVSELESRLQAERKASREIRAALEQSVKNEGKMQSIVRKLGRGRRELEGKLQASEKRYEDDVLQFMLENKSTAGQAQIHELEAAIARLESEKIALSRFIQASQNVHKKEIAELRRKLHSAFEVSSNFRREITRLTDELEYHSRSMVGSSGSSPGSKTGRRRNSVEFELRT